MAQWHISDNLLESPDELWEEVGWLQPDHMSFDAFLDALGLPEELPWWRQYLPYQGSLRAELLTAINLCNYNQANSQVNGTYCMANLSVLRATLRLTSHLVCTSHRLGRCRILHLGQGKTLFHHWRQSKDYPVCLFASSMYL